MSARRAFFISCALAVCSVSSPTKAQDPAAGLESLRERIGHSSSTITTKTARGAELDISPNRLIENMPNINISEEVFYEGFVSALDDINTGCGVNAYAVPAAAWILRFADSHRGRNAINFKMTEDRLTLNPGTRRGRLWKLRFSEAGMANICALLSTPQGRAEFNNIVWERADILYTHHLEGHVLKDRRGEVIEPYRTLDRTGHTTDSDDIKEFYSLVINEMKGVGDLKTAFESWTGFDVVKWDWIDSSDSRPDGEAKCDHATANTKRNAFSWLLTRKRSGMVPPRTAQEISASLGQTVTAGIAGMCAAGRTDQGTESQIVE